MAPIDSRNWKHKRTQVTQAYNTQAKQSKHKRITGAFFFKNIKFASDLEQGKGNVCQCD